MYQLRPMNCPFHIAVYKHKQYSYRDLPLRFAELGTVYRYERSGTMHGLFRVRGFTQVCAQTSVSPACLMCCHRAKGKSDGDLELKFEGFEVLP